MCSPGVHGGGGAAKGPGGQEGVVGRGVDASELSVPRMGSQGNDLGRQVVREWWCWGWEAGQGVLIIGFRTLVGSSTGALDSWICQSTVQTNSGIILIFMYYSEIGMGEVEESSPIHSFTAHMLTTKCHIRINKN